MCTVSIVIAAYNDARYLPATLASVQRQSLQDWQLIVVDDGSTDETGRVLQGYTRDGRIIVMTQSNQGQAVARNHALSKASGRYVAVLDADDLWHADKLRQQVRALDEESDVSIVGTLTAQFDDARVWMFEAQAALLRDGDDAVPQLLRDGVSPIAFSSVLIRRSALLDRDTLHHPQLRETGDHFLFLVALARQQRLQIIPRALTFRRNHPSQLMADRGFAGRLRPELQRFPELLTQVAPGTTGFNGAAFRRAADVSEFLIAARLGRPTASQFLRFCRAAVSSPRMRRRVLRALTSVRPKKAPLTPFKDDLADLYAQASFLQGANT